MNTRLEYQRQWRKDSDISHHLLFKSLYPKLMLNRNNGITLCKPCHYELHYGRRN